MKEIMELIQNPDQLNNLREEYLRASKQEREEIILALRDLKEENAARFLASMLSGEQDKEIQKLIRKQIFRLKTMGIKVDEIRQAGETALRKMEEIRRHKGFMFNFDPGGTRIIVTAFEVRRNNFIFVNAITHLTGGLVDLKLAPVTRQDFDTIMDQYRAETNSTIVLAEISPRYGAYLVEESGAVSHRYEEDVAQLKQFASSLKDTVQRPEDIYALRIPDAFEPLPPGAVLQHDMFASLVIPWDTMEEDRKTFAGFGDSALLLPSHLVEEKRETFLKALLASDALESRIPLLKRVLEDYGYIFFQIGRFDCYQAVLDLLTSDSGLTDALTFFAKKSLAVPKAEEQERQPGLIVNPYEQIRR